MANLLATVILLIISVFVINLFPVGREFFSGFTDKFNEKKENVVAEYDRVKGEVEGVVDTVNETKKKVEDTVDAVSDAVDTASDTIDKVNGFLGGDEEDSGNDADTEADQEPWRTSDPEIDPSIEAGRNNYNYADPGEDGLNEAHLYADIKPWIEMGNGSEDDSTKEARIAALAITEKGRQILDILGYEYDYEEE